jgi:hypothetical protein
MNKKIVVHNFYCITFRKTSRSKIQRLHINIITIPAIHKILAVTKGFTKNISQHLQPLKKLRYLKEQQGRKP